jgi:hypothetical protein
MIARIADGGSGTLRDFADRMYARKQLGLGQGGSGCPGVFRQPSVCEIGVRSSERSPDQ